ncbi:DNA-directed RNA polymerase subunit H [Candidatus Woesearchaeota archaeon]|nr:DNA-directed RNA polymerase subunit H [Candidatus Woesearchaeota archaeon]
MAKKNEKETNSKKTIKKVTVKKTAVKKEKAEKVVRTKKKTRADTKETSHVKHSLIPLHEKITEKEAQELFDYHNITIKELPKIIRNDPAIRHLKAKENDIIKITRTSSTAGKAIFYRGVINE